jgi:hypothetical protein
MHKYVNNILQFMVTLAYIEIDLTSNPVTTISIKLKCTKQMNMRRFRKTNERYTD